MRRHRLVMLAVGLAAVAVVAMALRRNDAAPIAPIDLSTVDQALMIDAPVSIVRSSQLAVDIGGVGPDDSEVRLDVISVAGVQRLVAAVTNGSATVIVPAELTRESGVLHLVASTGDAVGERDVLVLAGSVTEGIVPLAGPRSMIADGDHWTMVSVIPVDELGNGLPDSTPVVLHVRRPNGAVELVEGQLQGLLDGIRVFSGTLAGYTTIRVEVDGVSGPEVQVLEVAGPPIPFSLTGPLTPVRADGRTLVELRTSVLVDRFGNVLADGTSVTLQGEAPGGRFVVVAPTIAGQAAFWIEAPTTPGRLAATAYVGEVASEPVVVNVLPEAMSFDVAAERRSDGLVAIFVGPVTTDLGGFVPDGTDAVVIGADGTRCTVQLRSGRALVVLDAQPGDRLVVEVLAVRRTVAAP